MPASADGPGGYHRAMFSYRHAFHAGNHADVLKHITLIATVQHLMHKSGALTLVDTHAGAGIYRLDDEAAQTSGEALQGIAQLQALYAQKSKSNRASGQAESTRNAPDIEADALQEYLGLVASFNQSRPAGAPWRVYPGSPFLMHALMTQPERAAARDRLRLFELHPSDWLALQAHVAQLEARRQVSMAREVFESLGLDIERTVPIVLGRREDLVEQRERLPGIRIRGRVDHRRGVRRGVRHGRGRADCLGGTAVRTEVRPGRDLPGAGGALHRPNPPARPTDWPSRRSPSWCRWVRCT